MNLSIENEIDRFILSRWMYGLGTPIISDSDYNNLLRYMKSQNLLPEYTARTWSEDPIPLALLLKYNIGSSDVSIVTANRVLTSSMESIITIIDIENMFRHSMEEHRLHLKLDGWSTQALYSNGVLNRVESRGRDFNHISMEPVASLLPSNISLNNSISIAGELTLNSDNFIELQKRIGETRKSKRGSVRTAFTHECVDLLTFTGFRVWIDNLEIDVYKAEELLQEWGIETPQFKATVNSLSELLDTIEIWSELKGTIVEPTDGLVLRRVKDNYCLALRVKGWQESLHKSYITGYIDSYGAHYISTVVKIKPVELEGSTQKQVSVTNDKHLKEFNLFPGAPIAFTLTSQSIGVLDKDNTKLLHKEWVGRWEEYKHLIDNELL